MGPVLLFRGRHGDEWRLAAILVREGGIPPEDLVVDGAAPVAPTLLTQVGVRCLWRYEFAVRLGGEPRRALYAIGTGRWPIDLPAADGALRLAFTACNGTETQDDQSEENRNERWRHLAARHEEAGFHLLLQGGDQIYSDSLWHDIPALRAWKELPRRRKLKAPAPEAASALVAAYFFELYVGRWSDGTVGRVLASVPSLMMWDDHDIVDGWGSHSPAIQNSPVYRAIWPAAREAFAHFQLGASPDHLPEGFARPDGRHFTWAYRIGSVGIIAPDLRSTRTQRRVMDEAAWADFVSCLGGLAGCRHLVVVSSVPLINADPSLAERLLLMLPGVQNYQDDFRDQWQSIAHRAEWHRILRKLISFGRETGARITTVSGEIHMGCFGAVRSGKEEILQLTSSGIVHPPPPGPVVAFFEFMARKPRRLAPDLELEMLRMPGRSQRYLKARNWLEMEISPDGTLQGSWHAEDDERALSFSTPSFTTPSFTNQAEAPEHPQAPAESPAGNSARAG
jgi:hypothetical protein